MLSDILLAIRQLPDRAFRQVLLAGVAISLVVFGALVWLSAYLLSSAHWFNTGWLNEAVTALGTVGALALAVFLFPGVAIAVESLFLERVARAVERKHYPDLPAPRPQSIREAAVEGVRLGIVVLAVNLVLLPIYLLLTFAPPLNLVLYWSVNGYLIGREYFELVAVRRLSPEAARALRRRRRWPVLRTGALLAFLFSIPIVNFVAPLVATATMLHLYERLRRGAARAMPVLLLALVLTACESAGGPAPAPSPAMAPPARVPSGPVNVPDDLVGRTDDQVVTVLGMPVLVRRDGPARVFQYRTPACVLDVFLYGDAEGFRVAYTSLRLRDGRPAPAECFTDIRNRGARPKVVSR